MAETKNSAPAKFDKDELKDWFTLTEVADRWTKYTGQTFNMSDLLHFGEQALLEICFQGKNSHFLSKQIPLSDEENRLSFWYYQYCKNHDVLGHSHMFEKGFFVKEGGNEYNCDLFALNIPSIKRFKSENETQVFGGAIGETYFEFGRTFFSAEDPEGKNSFVPLPETIHINDLVITKQERDRFEKEHRIGAHAGEMPNLSKPDKLDGRIEKTYLQIIRALAIEAGYTLERPYKDADTLMESAARHGLIMPSKRDTIAEKLKDAANLSD